MRSSLQWPQRCRPSSLATLHSWETSRPSPATSRRFCARDSSCVTLYEQSRRLWQAIGAARPPAFCLDSGHSAAALRGNKVYRSF